MTTSKSAKVLVLTIGNGINILINFLTLPYLVRSLSFEDYGSYGQVIMIISLLQGIFTFNLNQIATVHFSQGKYTAEEVFSTLMRITFFMSLLGSIIMLICIPLVSVSFDNAIITKLLSLSLLNLLGQIPVPILISVLIYFGKIKATSFILVITNLMKIAVMFCAIQYYNSVEYLLMGLSLVSILQTVILFFSVPLAIRKIHLYRKALATKFFGMATPLAISSLIEKSLVYIDGIMISAMLTTTSYAFYRAGAVEVPLIATFYSAVAAIIMPEIAKLFHDNNIPEIIRLKRLAIAGTAFFVYPVLIYLLYFANPLISFYLSDSYSQSAIIFAIFNLSLLIRINDYQDVIIISGNSKYIFRAVLFSSIVNLFLNYSLILVWGITGSAISFIVSLTLFAWLLTWKSTQILKCRFSDLFDIPLILKIVLLSMFVVNSIYLLYYFCFNTVWFIIFASPIYALIVFLLGVKFGLLPATLKLQLQTKWMWLKEKI
jgi:O-antigen/teichoic acid export membrane protein